MEDADGQLHFVGLNKHRVTDKDGGKYKAMKDVETA